jgi:hypothetical protein
MPRVKNRATILAFLLLLAALQAHACEWTVGYLYQVTALKGQVVGTTYHGLPRWLRQSFAKKHAKLVLYGYRWLRAENNAPPIIKVVEPTARECLISAPSGPDITH